MKKTFTLLVILTATVQLAFAQNWELFYGDSLDTRELSVIDDTLYFTRNVPTGPSTYVNYLYRSTSPGTIIDSILTLNGIYGADNYNRFKGNQYLVTSAPSSGNNGFRKKAASSPYFNKKSSKSNYLIDKPNNKIYVADSYHIEVSTDEGETFSNYWRTNDGRFGLLGFDRNGDLLINIRSGNTDSMGVWRISDNGNSRKRIWTVAPNVFYPESYSLVKAVNSNRIYLFDTSNNRIAYSDNDGTNWTTVSYPGTTIGYGYNLNSILPLSDGNLLIAVGSNSGTLQKKELIYKAGANGDNIQEFNTGLPVTQYIRQLVSWKNNIYARSLKGIYKLQNNSTTSLPKENLIEDNILIYPNPATSEINIAFGKKASSVYSIYNNAGQIVQEGNLQSEKPRIDINNLNSGIYYLQFDKQSTKHKVVITR